MLNLISVLLHRTRLTVVVQSLDFLFNFAIPRNGRSLSGNLLLTMGQERKTAPYFVFIQFYVRTVTLYYHCHKALAEGVEPPTGRVETVCSNPLSYASVNKTESGTNANTDLLTGKPFLIPASLRYSEPKTQGGSLTASCLVSVMTSPVKPVIVITQSYVLLLPLTVMYYYYILYIVKSQGIL